MEKKLTDNQKKIINSLVEEFTKENVTAKKINSKSLINQIEDKLSLVNKQEDEVRKYNILEGKKTEAFFCFCLVLKFFFLFLLTYNIITQNKTL